MTTVSKLSALRTAPIEPLPVAPPARPDRPSPDFLEELERLLDLSRIIGLARVPPPNAKTWHGELVEQTGGRVLYLEAEVFAARLVGWAIEPGKAAAELRAHLEKEGVLFKGYERPTSLRNPVPLRVDALYSGT